MIAPGILDAPVGPSAVTTIRQQRPAIRRAAIFAQPDMRGTTTNAAVLRTIIGVTPITVIPITVTIWTAAISKTAGAATPVNATTPEAASSSATLRGATTARQSRRRAANRLGKGKRSKALCR